MTSTKGTKPTRQDIEIAKNYLDEKELEMLNRLVSAYLDLAEIQAMNQKPMYMQDWTGKLDEFIRISGNDILEHAGKISHEKAVEKAKEEYEKFKAISQNEPSQVEIHFIEHIEGAAKKLKKGKK